MVLISIITPVYNNVDYIEKCILNVIDQEISSIEHLIVDGGSTDGTVEIIADYAAKFPHIKWVSEKDKGQSDAMNKGISLSKGKYLSFLNVDDYYSPKAIEEVSLIIKKNSEYDFIVGNCHVWKENGKLLYINYPTKLKPWHMLSGFYFPVNPSSYFYKKEIHSKTKMYNVDNHYNMDLEFLIETSFVSIMKYVPKNWGNFRLLPNTKTVSDNENGLMEIRKKELLNRFLKKSTIKIKVLTYGVIILEITKRKFIRLKKALWIPFDMIYWKWKKIIAKK